MSATKPEMEAKLAQLIRLQEDAVGIDLRRLDYQIAQLQGSIDHYRGDD